MSSGQRQTQLSVIFPIRDSNHGLSEAIILYDDALKDLGEPFEILLVAGSGQWNACASAAVTDTVRVIEMPTDSWGALVRAGISACSGDIICFANWKRTSTGALALMLRYALRNPELVLRANRRTRDTFHQRLGSLLFNLECRAVLGTAAWDINGTPKIFSRARTRLRELSREDDLIDAEFALVCELMGYPVAEIPIDARPRERLRDSPDYRKALLMYFRVLSLRRRARR